MTYIPNNPLEPDHVPNPKLHKYVSFAKSILRIIAGLLLVVSCFPGAGILFIVAEVLGIAEELV